MMHIEAPGSIPGAFFFVRDRRARSHAVYFNSGFGVESELGGMIG